MTADATRLLAAVQRWASGVQARNAELVPALVKATGDVPIKDGELRGSIRAEHGQSGGTNITFRVVAPVIQAVTTDKGARRHPIVPRRAGGLLVFYWPKAGGVVAFRHVDHPGNAAQNWWKPALEKAYRQAMVLSARTTPFR